MPQMVVFTNFKDFKERGTKNKRKTAKRLIQICRLASENIQKIRFLVFSTQSYNYLG